MVQEKASEVYDILEYVVRDHPVLLNRAPTLHRLGIQAFQPVLVDGKAIQIHPLVCAAFNADFDGDQMAVHVPLSVEAQMEARMLMLSSHNILHPAHGYPLAIPSQDMVLGVYYLTKEKKGDIGEGRRFSSLDEVLMAYENKSVGLHAIVDVRHHGKWYKQTTVGRSIFNSIVPDELEYIDELLNKKKVETIIYNCFLTVSNFRTVQFLDDLKHLGFKFATQSGVSIAIDDVLIPVEKESIIAKADKEVHSIPVSYTHQTLPKILLV